MSATLGCDQVNPNLHEPVHLPIIEPPTPLDSMIDDLSTILAKYCRRDTCYDTLHADLRALVAKYHTPVRSV